MNRTYFSNKISFRGVKIGFKHIFPFCLTVLLTFVSCNDFLEENPDNRVELNTIQKASQLLTNAYTDAGYNFTEWMTDNVDFIFGTRKNPEHYQLYSWSEVTEIFQDTPTNYWNETYEAIAHANEVLAVIDNLPGDEARRNAVKGEALLARAYGHFMLVNLFAKHYDSQTASKDLGIPYVEEPEKVFVKEYERNTIREVYSKIERDLKDGLDLVNNSFYVNSGKYHFTREAALAFASRLYLFKRDYVRCLEYSNQLLGSDPDVYIKDIPRLLQERVNTDDYIRLYTSPTDESNLMLVRQVSNAHLPYVGFWPSSPLYSQIFEANPFNATDERQDPAWVAGENGLAATKLEFLFERSSLTSNVGYNYTIFPAFRGEEVLLNRAECLVIQNNLNDAIADLQLLANKRYREQVTVTLDALKSRYPEYANNNQIVVLAYILDERQREFLHEGLRWFDLKRYGFPVNHVTEDGQLIILEEDDPRKVLQIPKSAIDVGGLEPNPR